ncbi:MAG: hypothetical protein NTV97_33935 [Alphaproteobacteria bacterium]|nr:hypothetical protein [Alphaproteobacteria bacterium]
MPWITFRPATRNETQRAMLSLTVPARATACPFLLLSGELVLRLGWKPGKGLSLAYGDGPDHGQLRVQPDPDEQTVLAPPTRNGKRKRFRVFIGRMPCLNGEPTKCEPAYCVQERTLLVTIPEHARARQLAKRS